MSISIRSKPLNIQTLFPELLFLVCVVTPALVVEAAPDFYHSEQYGLILFIFAVAWFLGALLSQLSLRKKYTIPSLIKPNYFLNKKSTAKITYVNASLLIIYFIVSVNIGIMKYEIRLNFEGSVFHKLILLNIFLIASYGLLEKKAFLLLFVVVVLTGWKSIVLYLVVAYLNQFKINFYMVIKFLGVSLFLLIIFSVINMSRQGVLFSDMTLISGISFLDVLYYYILYGFINFSYNLYQLSDFSIFLSLDLGNSTVIPTWNVQSGFHGLLNIMGVFCGSIFLILLRVIGSCDRNQPICNYFHYIMILTIIMFHNTMIALSPIVFAFPICLYFLEKYAKHIKIKIRYFTKI